MESPHIPVLFHETLFYLNLSPGERVLDCTLGFGGHSAGILEKIGAEGFLIGLDRDPEALAYARKRITQENICFIHSAFSQAGAVFEEKQLEAVDAVLADIGMSSFHLDSSGRGFRFMESQEPLDMRMDPALPLTAADILNTYNEQALSDLFFTLGELHQNKRLSQRIVTARKKSPIRTTEDLVELIHQSYFFGKKRHLFFKVASQVFQALRIEVNGELDQLTDLLNSLDGLLKPGGRVVIISFHSLEDRIVKQFFRANKSLYSAINKKVVVAKESEISHNPRSRSAKLRGFIKSS